MRPSRLIRGTVREKGTGKVLAGIGIHGRDTTAYVWTDAQGRYELPGCPKGRNYIVLAEAIHGEPYIASSTAVVDMPGLGRSRGRIWQWLGRASLSGTISGDRAY